MTSSEAVLEAALKLDAKERAPIADERIRSLDEQVKRMEQLEVSAKRMSEWTTLFASPAPAP